MTYADSLFRYGRSDFPSTAAWAKGNAWTSVIACWRRFNELRPETAGSKMGPLNSKAPQRAPQIAGPKTPPHVGLQYAGEILLRSFGSTGSATDEFGFPCRASESLASGASRGAVSAPTRWVALGLLVADQHH